MARPIIARRQVPGLNEQQAIHRFGAILAEVRTHRLVDAVAEIESWIDAVRDPAMRGEMARLLGFFWLRRDDFAKAIRFSDMGGALLPDSTDCAYNAGFAMLRLGRWEDLVRRGLNAIERFGDRFEWHNLLATAYGHLGRFAEVRRHGTMCLALKDAAARGSALDVSPVAVQPFDPANPDRNVISFSLFGSNERYTRTAVLNATAARFLYLGWRCRFHVDDSVPPDVLRALAAEGAEIRHVQGLPADPYGTFWRFMVADDPQVDRYIVRDADSVLNTREFVAVQEWLVSGRHFHVMRDSFDHAELVLAGMWGGVRGAFPPLLPWASQFLASRGDIVGRTADQEFLRDQLWPTIRTSVMTHDSFFAFGGGRPFPPGSNLPPGCHVGCDGRAMLGLDGSQGRPAR